MNLDRYRFHLRILFWCALTGAFILAIMPRPPHLPTDAFGDKFNHILAFAVMALLGTLGWPDLPRLRLVARLSMFGALIEVVQAIPALHRDSDLRDWIADTLAVLAVAVPAGLIARRTAPRRGQ